MISFRAMPLANGIGRSTSSPLSSGSVRSGVVRWRNALVTALLQDLRRGEDTPRVCSFDWRELDCIQSCCVLHGNSTRSENYPQHGNKDHRSFTAANQRPVVFGGPRL